MPMRLRKLQIVLIAWALHAAAWFLPVIKGGETFPSGLPGWQAFRVAACAIWPYAGFHFDAWYYAALGTASAVTTLLFIFVSPWIALGGSRSLRRVSGWASSVAFVLNVHWFVLFGSDRSDLRTGYFLWWLSFALLAAGFFASLKGEGRAEAA